MKTLKNWKQFNETKEFTIKRKRDGQGFEPTGGSVFANSWAEAKQKWTDIIRNDIANNIDFERRDDGLYRIDGWGTESILDHESLDTFKDDVWTWTIKRV